jgi:hypothetical protein
MQRVDHRKFLKNSKSASNYSNPSESCRKPFLPSNQTLSIDEKQLWNIWSKYGGGGTNNPRLKKGGPLEIFEKMQKVLHPLQTFWKLL